ncbi:PE-PGRS family protein [Kitasatospora misakiensis]|uniref:PE-PGRS family protein n=1 Tax=Kitasatospora misakiensis TaxID=67330 RepID=A0ABW0WXY2_9ACTN
MTEAPADWAPVLELTCATPELRDLWRTGVLLNDAAPLELRTRVIEECGHGDPLLNGLTYMALPEAVVDAWIAHPVARVRARAAERVGLTVAQQKRLLRDESAGVRGVVLLVGGPDLALDEAEFDRLLADASPIVREQLACQQQLSVRQLTLLLGDPFGSVRAAVVGRVWPYLDEATRAALSADRHSGVRAAAVLARYADEPLPAGEFAALTDGCEEADRRRIVGQCALAPELAGELAHGDVDVRRALAGNPRLDADLVALLARDEDPAVRLTVSLRPELTEAERARIPVDIDPGSHHAALPWVLERQGDAAEMRRCAASAHVLVRRSVAHVRDLPADVVELLARDEDFAVRLLLAEHCAQAAAGLLLEMWVSWNGYSQPRLREHPNFPRAGSLRFAADPNPLLRRLALDDPAAPEDLVELVERFGRDKDAGVRLRALEDPRLSAASVERLVGDEDWLVRCRALRDPRLPEAALVGLIADVRTAQGAASHPAVPAEVLRHLLELPVV